MKASICYQCDKYVAYLFPDARCKDCTRITPDELVNGIEPEEEDDDAQ